MMYEETLLACIKAMEEAAEVQHVICKAIRFGVNNWHPDTPKVTNRQLIQSEISDLRVALDSLEIALRGEE